MYVHVFESYVNDAVVSIWMHAYVEVTIPLLVCVQIKHYIDASTYVWVQMFFYFC